MNTTQLEALLEGPAMVPPAGVIPNFVDPFSLKPRMVGVAITCTIIPTLAVCMRLFVKCRLVRHLHKDDYLMMIAWFCYIAYSALYLYGLIRRPDAGVHQWNVPLKRLNTFLWYTYVFAVFYPVLLALIKVAILVQILRGFVPTGQRSPLFWMVHVLIWANIFCYLTGVFLVGFSCSPVRKSYDVFVTSGRCLDVLAIDVAGGVFNVVSDFAILMVPQTVIWRLQMPLRKKIGLSLVFLFGIFAMALAAMRLYPIIKLVGSNDTTYWASLMGMYAHLEFAFGFLVLCVPVLPKFVTHLKEKTEQFRTSFGATFARVASFPRSNGSNTLTEHYIRGSFSSSTQPFGSSREPSCAQSHEVKNDEESKSF